MPLTIDISGVTEKEKEEYIRMTFRIPRTLCEKLDRKRKAEIMRLSRNQFILMAIDYFLEATE